MFKISSTFSLRFSPLSPKREAKQSMFCLVTRETCAICSEAVSKVPRRKYPETSRFNWRKGLLGLFGSKSYLLKRDSVSKIGLCARQSARWWPPDFLESAERNYRRNSSHQPFLPSLLPYSPYGSTATVGGTQSQRTRFGAPAANASCDFGIPIQRSRSSKLNFVRVL